MEYRLQDQDLPTREALAALGSAFLEIRRARGLTQRQLAHRSGLSQASISKLETGKAPWLRVIWVARVLASLDYDEDLDGFRSAPTPPPDPAWKVLMRRFESRRRRLDLRPIRAAAAAERARRTEALRRELMADEWTPPTR